MRRKEVCVVLHSWTGRAWCHLWWDFRQRLNTSSEQKRRQETMLLVNETFLFSYPVLCGCSIVIPYFHLKFTSVNPDTHYLLLDIYWLNKCCTHTREYIEATNLYCQLLSWESLQMFQFKVFIWHLKIWQYFLTLLKCVFLWMLWVVKQIKHH